MKVRGLWIASLIAASSMLGADAFADPIVEDCKQPKKPSVPQHIPLDKWGFSSHRSSDTTKALLKKCIEKKSIPEGTWKKVSYISSTICKKRPPWLPDVVHGSDVAYKIRKQSGKIEIASKISFDYKGKPENRDAVINRLEFVHGCVQAFYRKFGIHLNLDFEINSGLSAWLGSDHTVALHDEYPRANAVNWPMLKNSKKSLTEDQACMLSAHEFGHLLGLPDRYIDQDCPDRETIGNYDALMTSCMLLASSDTVLDPVDIAFIIKPLCGEPEPEEQKWLAR